MKGAGSHQSWFAALRRDRGLFALVGALAVLLGLLQPVAAAKDATFADLLVICTDHSSPAPADHPPAGGPDCPLCPTGHLCGLAGFLGTAASAAPAVIPPERDLPTAIPAGTRLAAPAGEAPPAIRGPPLPA
ncbi:hypothetical protein [Chelativorans sp.]|uniref:hypothetical protein n=1 Tax=Chelativorans sp. TaxID=2203393 RepID=UPI00281185E8|nr:hypothetical protein [Chelativorans sp.]